MPLVLHNIFGFAVFLALVYWFWQTQGKNAEGRIFFWPALLFKLACGVALGYFYAANFDTHKYQEIASNLTNLFWLSAKAYFKVLYYTEMPDPALFSPQKAKIYTNTFFLIKLLSLLNFLTGKHYYLNSFYLSFFSFAGCWYFIQTAAKFFPVSRLAGILGFLFFPSVVLWTSGVLKDGILIGSLCIIWATVLEMVANPREKIVLRILVLLVSAWLLWKIKYFVAVLVYGLTGFWIFWRWVRKFEFMRSKLVLGSSLALFLIVASVALSQLHEHFSMSFFMERLIWNYNRMIELSPGRPTIEFHFTPNVFSVVENIPKALWSVMFRPYFWEGNNMLYKLAGLENIALMILVAGSFLDKGFWRKKWPVFYVLLLVFCLILAVVFAMATPNLGSLNRYRATFLPFLLFLLLQTPFWQQVLERVSGLFRRLAGCR